MSPELRGLHHVTAISARIADNVRFYTGVLGLRLVKRSVNQDDVRAYHLFYADARGTPGTDLTFFDWPAPPERRGTRSIARTSLRVEGGGEALDWWAERLADFGVESARSDDGAEPVLTFEDPEGQRLALLADGGPFEAEPWERSPVPVDRQLRGLGPVVLDVPRLDPSASFLETVLGMRPAGSASAAGPGDPAVAAFECGPGGAGARVVLVERPGAPAAQQGAGGVHHVAFRIADADHEAWIRRLDDARIGHSGSVDRFWFRSLYFREPSGILFEIATDGPGFGIDEDEERLGETVVLPPFLEPRRAGILAGLAPLPRPGEEPPRTGS